MDLRSYDPAIARWTGIDPVTHHSMSTYTAFDNNPVFWADPSGADATLGADGLSNDQWLYNTSAERYDEGEPLASWGSPGHGYSDAFDAARGMAQDNFYTDTEKRRRTQASVQTGEIREVKDPPLTGTVTVTLDNGFTVTLNRAIIYGGVDSRVAQSHGTSNAIDWVQGGLDAFGIVPGVGEIADGINAVIYTIRGDYLNAGLSTAAMIPFAGWAATGGKMVKKGLKYSKRVDEATDLYHSFPSSFDYHIIKNGSHSKRIKDGADWFEMPGYINGTNGMYQIGVNQKGYIFHKSFVPYKQWLKY